MTYTKWVKQYCIKGKKWDWDSVSNVQCVDLAKCYFDVVFGIPCKKGQAVWGNACDYWLPPEKLKDDFFKIANTADFVPMAGDVAIWGKNYSSSHNCGHIAVCTGDGNTSYFMVYEQNRTGKNDGVAYNKQTYNKDFKGVLRPYRYIKKDVNIRYRPSVSSSLMGEYKKGTKVKVLNVSSDGKWYKTPNGWCSANYFKEIGG